MSDYPEGSIGKAPPPTPEQEKAKPPTTPYPTPSPEPTDKPMLTPEEIAEMADRINANPNLQPLPEPTEIERVARAMAYVIAKRHNNGHEPDPASVDDWTNDQRREEATAAIAAMSEREQINKLAEFIMHKVPGEPSKDEGAVDCAIRIIARLREREGALREALKTIEDYVVQAIEAEPPLDAIVALDAISDVTRVALKQGEGDG